MSDLSSLLTTVSGAARRERLVALTVRMVDAAHDPYADRAVDRGPELEVVVQRRCCTVTSRVTVGRVVADRQLACPHQEGR